LCPPVQVPVESQVAEKPIEKVSAVATSSTKAVADRVKNSLIAAQIVPPVQAPVGSQVVEKPTEKVSAMATSSTKAAAVSSSLVPVKDAKSGVEKVSTESANDDASVSSLDSSCSCSSGNSSSTSSSGQSSSSESSKQLLEKNVADDGNTVGVDGVTTATVAIADVIAAVSAATSSAGANSSKPPFCTLGDTALANEPGWLLASILQTPLPIVEEKYGPRTSYSESSDHASSSEDAHHVDDVHMEVVLQEKLVPQVCNLL